MNRLTSAVSTPFCQLCQQKVYAMEGIKLNGKHLHERCFKCAVCQARLSIAAFRETQGVFLCPRHAKECALAAYLV